MRSKQLPFIFIVLAVIAACGSKDRKFNIIGNITGMPQQTIILEQINANDIITIVDSGQSNTDGHFELSGVSPEPGLYRLHFSTNKFILLAVDKGNLKVSATWDALEDYNIDGSPSSEHLRKFVVSIREHLRDINTMGIVLDTLQAHGNDSMMAIAKKDFQDMRVGFTQFVEHYADTTPYEPNAVFAARILNANTESNYLFAFSQGLARRFPGTAMTRDFGEYYSKAASRNKHDQQHTAHADSGTIAPEVTLQDPEGKTISLSSFKGKYVLLDFWASWCGPCRGENPNVVAAFEQFKDKNFTIFSVSLDNNKSAWEKAIKDDGLTWTQVSDLKGWSSSAAAAYSVQSIPTNFLIDPTGRIIASNLRGPQLTEMLEKVLNTPQ